MIKPSDFIDAVDDAQVVAAIQQAEARTSCEFRVLVSQRTAVDPVKAAEKQFVRLKMHATKLRNAVLIYIAPRSRKFALYADVAAHAHVGQPLVERLAAEMSERFKQSGYTEGLVQVLDALSAALAEAFPPSGDSGNELSDAVEREE